MSIAKPLLLIPLLTGTVSAESYLQILNFPRPSLLQAVVVTGVIILIVIFAVLYETGRKSSERRAMKKSSETAFNMRVADLGLSDRETVELRRMANPNQYGELNNILSSISVFEQHVEKEVQRLITVPDPYQKTEVEETLSGIRKKLRFNYLENEHPLVSTRNISVGQPMVILSRDGRVPVIQQARVVANKELYFRVQYDLQRETQISLQRGDHIKVVFPRHADGMYEIDLMVAAFDRPGWIDFYHTLNLARHQLRRDVRLDLNTPLKFRVLETGDPIEKERFGASLLSARIADISGGGLSFINDTPLKPEDILSLNFSLSEAPITGIQAKLLRVNPQQGKEDTVFKHHMQYVDIDPVQKEKIVKYVFEKMRQRKQQAKDSPP